MNWLNNTLPKKEQINKDLEDRNINAEKWWKEVERDNSLLEKFANCYSKIFTRGKFDEQLYRCGVNLRLNSYCEWLEEKYPELRKE